MPANTVMLSQVMRELSAQPGFTDALLSRLNSGGKKGPALLTPRLVDELRKLILGKDWQGLDRFPGWNVRALTAGVQVAGRVAPAGKQTNASALRFLDIGPYAIDQPGAVSLDTPSTAPGFTTNGIVVPLGDGVVYGDGPSPLAANHAESQRLADSLNRLAANSLERAATFTVKFHGQSASTPEQLIEILMSASDVAIDDARFFANFAHLHYHGQDVMAPFWINTQWGVPGTGGFLLRERPLLVPASHAEYELHLHSTRSGGPWNADVSYYFGIDGKSEWRTMDTLDEAWVLRRNAHEYRDDQAREVMRLTTLMTLAYMHQHQLRPDLPFGGYYTLGVCQDGIAAIEKKMTGRVTLFPNTADNALFALPADSEINALMQAVPKDRNGVAPDPERVFGALPTINMAEITIPGLAQDLTVTYTAWKAGKLKPHS